MKKIIAVTLATVGAALLVSAQDAAKLPPASTKTGVTYETDIKPIFDATCIRCHGDKRPGAGIVLTDRDSILKGGKDGKIIVGGDSTKGDLIASVAHLGDDPQTFMPKGKTAKKLSDDQIGLIRAWIDQGAK